MTRLALLVVLFCTVSCKMPCDYSADPVEHFGQRVYYEATGKCPAEASSPGSNPDAVTTRGAVIAPVACAPAAGDDPCVACVRASCCATMTACLDEQACTCLVTCRTPTETVEACAAPGLCSAASDDAAYGAVHACVTTHCSAQCPRLL